VVLAGRTVRPDLPLDACNCTETKPTRYARKVSCDAVLVIVTTAVPLQPASASNAAPKGATLPHALRMVEKRPEQDTFIGWINPLGEVLFSDSCRN
jgi:hypothetical protein